MATHTHPDQWRDTEDPVLATVLTVLEEWRNRTD